MTRRLLGSLLLVVSVVGCGSRPPATPTPTRYVLGGLVTSNAQPVGAATLEIVDGPNTGLVTISNDVGRYQFATLLQQGAFVIRASAAGMAPASKSGTLSADTSLDFDLIRTPQADLHGVNAGIDGTLESDGTYSFSALAENRGDGCAGSVSGITDFTDANRAVVATLAWALSGGTIVQPGERFSYRLCCLPPAQAFAGGSFVTRFGFITVTCE